jgi:hypothetical protein
MIYEFIVECIQTRCAFQMKATEYNRTIEYGMSLNRYFSTELQYFNYSTRRSIGERQQPVPKAEDSALRLTLAKVSTKQKPGLFIIRKQLPNSNSTDAP